MPAYSLHAAPHSLGKREAHAPSHPHAYMAASSQQETTEFLQDWFMMRSPLLLHLPTYKTNKSKNYLLVLYEIHKVSALPSPGRTWGPRWGT